LRETNDRSRGTKAENGKKNANFLRGPQSGIVSRPNRRRRSRGIEVQKLPNGGSRGSFLFKVVRQRKGSSSRKIGNEQRWWGQARGAVATLCWGSKKKQETRGSSISSAKPIGKQAQLTATSGVGSERKKKQWVTYMLGGGGVSQGPRNGGGTRVSLQTRTREELPSSEIKSRGPS